LSRAEIAVQIQRLAGADDLPLPEYQTAESAAVDLHAAVTATVTVAPGAIEVIPTGLAIALPSGYEAQVRPRSGLAVKHGLSLPNSPATIDADYRGEIRVPLINHGTAPVHIERGMRIAQMLVVPVPRIVWEVVDELPVSARGSGGFGHTGA
jgi:dUTP pyrophosphatase